MYLVTQFFFDANLNSRKESFYIYSREHEAAMLILLEVVVKNQLL